MGSNVGARRRVLRVHAEWDAEAGVWVATSEDVPGLVTEAETAEQLIAKLQILIPELQELNNRPNGDTPVELVTLLPQRDRCAA